MPNTKMTTRWRDEPLLPESFEDPEALVSLAREARRRTVELDWELSREELERLRAAAYEWGRRAQGRYKKFDAEIVAAISRILEEPESKYSLNVPNVRRGSTAR